MARAQFKLLLFLFVTGLFAGVLALGWWLYQNVYLSEQRVQHELEAMKDQDRPRIDPGAKRFDAAIALVRGGGAGEFVLFPGAPPAAGADVVPFGRITSGADVVWTILAAAGPIDVRRVIRTE